MVRHAPLDGWYATQRGQAFSRAIIAEIDAEFASLAYQSRIGWAGYAHAGLQASLAKDYTLEARAIATLDDAICARVMAMHIFDGAEEAEAVIAQGYRVLEAQGEMVLIARNGLCLRERCGLEKGMGLSRGAIRMMLEDAGFEDVAVRPIFARSPSLLTRTVFGAAQCIVPHLLIATGRKCEHGVTPLRVRNATAMTDGVPA